MAHQIDQSGKIEQTNLITVVALSNDNKYSVLIEKKTKRILQSIFRDQNTPRKFIYLTFAALIAFILKETQPKEKIVIDIEYPGHSDIIKKQIIDFLRKIKSKYSPVLEFGLIGKSSPADELASKVAHGKLKPDKKISLEEISRIIWGE